MNRKLKRLLKRVKKVVKRVNKLRTFGSWKIGVKVRLPDKKGAYFDAKGGQKDGNF